MSFSIILKTTEFSQSVGNIVLPDRSGLVGEYILGENQSESVKNRAGGPSATVVGTPTYGEGYISTESGSASHGLDTGLVVPTNATVLIVSKAPTGSPVILGNASLFGFVGAYLKNTVFNTQLGALANIAEAQPQSPTDFRFFAGVFPLGGVVTAYSIIGGTTSTAVAAVAGGASRGTQTLKLGTTLSGGSGTGVAHIAYAAVFNRLLTQAQVEAAYTSLRAYLQTRGASA